LRRPSRLRPEAARHANRARRTWWAFVFFPIFLAYQVVDTIRDVAHYLARERTEDLERRPPFARPDDMPTPDERTMADIVRAVEAFPFRPARISTQTAFFRDNGPDAIGALFSSNPQAARSPHRYPASFSRRLFAGDGGVQVAAMQAMHEHVGPAVVISHGLLMTKDFDVIIQLARRAFEQWGFHVVTVDLRGWGHSAWTTDAPASAGFHEGRDIVEVARELQRDPRVTSVAGVGFSLGGCSMLNAAVVSSRSDDRPLDGGVVAISAPSKVREALRHISIKPHWRDAYFGLWHVFAAAIKETSRRRGLGSSVRTWEDLAEHVSAPYYGLGMDEFCERASAVEWADEIDQPVLELHAADDFLVPVHHAYALQDAAADNPWVHVMVRDSGAHCSFNAADPSWYHSTVRRWLEYWATPGASREERDDPAEDTEAVVG
ncbi:MAG: peptidase, partial [Thermoleophilia bacterium]|nr:peptidase [Thermoleophilia bacterium]